jgi:hypothetical protein
MSRPSSSILSAAAGYGDVGMAIVHAYWAGVHAGNAMCFTSDDARAEAINHGNDETARAVGHLAAWREAGRPVPPPPIGRQSAANPPIGRQSAEPETIADATAEAAQ